MSYNAPDKICFTRKSNDSLSTIRTHDLFLLSNDIFGTETYHNVGFQIFIHHPGQLFRSLDNPVYKSKVAKRVKEGQQKLWDNILRIKVEEVTVLRKRDDANVPCNNQLNDLDDSNIMEQITDKVGCLPIFWKYFVLKPNVRECNSPLEYQNIFKNIQEYRDVLWSYDPPCASMHVSTKIDKDETNEWGNPCINIQYTTREYQEIQNEQSFGFESFVSGVGGFVGIFLGYSLLQIPELLAVVFSRLVKLKIRGQKKRKNKATFRRNIKVVVENVLLKTLRKLQKAKN